MVTPLSNLRALWGRALWRAFGDLVVWFARTWQSPEKAGSFARLARSAALAQDSRSAIIYARASVAANPAWPDGYDVLAYAYAMAGESQRAKEVLVPAVRQWTQNARLLIRLGRADSALGNREAAIAAYQAAVDAEPKNSEALTHLGIALLRARRLDDAASHAPADSLVATALGEVSFRLGEYATAVGFCQEAIRLDPSGALAHYFLGASLAWLGRRAEALEHHRGAVELEPDNAEFREALGKVELLDEFSRAWEKRRQQAHQGEPFSMIVEHVRRAPNGDVRVGGFLESGFPRRATSCGSRRSTVARSKPR